MSAAHEHSRRRLGYLSASLRVATRSDAEISGPRAHVVGVISAFEALGWEVDRFIVGDRLPPSVKARGQKWETRSSRLRRLAADALRVGLSYRNARAAWSELGRRPEWVYERFAVFQSLGWIFKRRGIPWILETNGPFFYEARTERNSISLARLAKHLEIRAYRDADVVVAISQSLKDILVEHAGISPHKVVVIPNATSPQRFDPDRVEPIRMHDGFVVGFVGIFNNWQGLDLLIRAIRELRDEGMEISAVLVGDGQARAAWETETRRLGLQQHVTFTGRVPWDDVAGYLAGFDLCYSGQAQMQIDTIYHSPLKIYEYMAMAKPVLASSFEETERLLDEDATGFLFRASDLDDLKRALAKAYRRRDALPAMGRAARKELLEKHTWEQRVAILIEKAEQILKESKECAE